MKHNIGALSNIYEKIKELNRQNNLLKDKYNSDTKYARIHKRLVEKGDISKKESEIFAALQSVKDNADLQVLQNTKLLNNEDYFSKQMIKMVIDQFKNKNKINLNSETSKYINNLIVNEYINEFYGRSAW
jgi:type I restriction enzyme R subunit